MNKQQARGAEGVKDARDHDYAHEPDGVPGDHPPS
jgi:hypothetical protein